MTTTSTPTLWFSAPIPLLNSPSPAGAQFMDLFSDPASWQTAADGTSVFVLQETFVAQATTQQLQEVVSFLVQNHIAIALNAEMIPVQANGAGQGLEGYGSPTVLQQCVERISSLGGTLSWVSMDGPLAYGSQDPSGAELSVTALAQQVAISVAAVKAIFPDVQFQDNEGMTTTGQLAAWAQAFEQATGSPIAQINADINWADSNWQTELQGFAAAVRSTGATFGIIGDGLVTSQSSAAWTLSAEQFIAASLADPLIDPANVKVTSWDPYPTDTTDEGSTGALAHVAMEYTQFAPLYARGYFTGSATGVATVVPAPNYVGWAADAVVGAPVAVAGVQIDATGASPGMTFAVVLSDQSGLLAASASSGGSVSGAGSAVLTLTGTLAAINAELASLTYAATTQGGDTIDVTTYDGAGLVDDHSIVVEASAPVGVALPAGAGAATIYQNIFGQAPGAATLAAAQAQLAAGKTLAQVVAPWLAQAQSTVTGLYAQVQGESPTAAALASSAAALVGGESVAQLRAALAAAPSVPQELAAVYQSHYGAAPTAAQLAALTAELAGGASLQSVETPLLANSAAAAEIATLYAQVEGQAPDASDQQTEARALLTGTALATIRGELANSPVVQTDLANLYQHVYDQAPTAAQLATLTGQIVGGQTLAQVEGTLTAVAQSEVTAVFQQALGCAPTAAQLAGWTTDLTNGNTTIGGIRAQLVYSPSTAGALTAMYQQVTGQTLNGQMLVTLENCLDIGQVPMAQLPWDVATADALYQQITGQAATPTALDPLMADFLNQASVAQIRYWVAYSGPVIQTISNAYQALFGNQMGAQLAPVLQALDAGTTSMVQVQASLQAQAAADVPVIGGTVASQTLDANGFLVPLAATTLADPDPGAIETVTVAIAGAGGKLVGGGGGTRNASDTSYTAKGTPGIVQAGLRGLYLESTGGVGSEQLTLTVTNGAGHSSSATIAITESSVLLTPATAFTYLPQTSETVSGTTACNTYVVPAGSFGQDTISGFAAGRDIIELPKADLGSFAAVEAHTSAASGGALIAVGASSSILLPGVAPASLLASDFKFV